MVRKEEWFVQVNNMEELIDRIKIDIEIQSGKVYWIKINEGSNEECNFVADLLISIEKDIGCKFIISSDRFSIEDITKEFKNNI